MLKSPYPFPNDILFADTTLLSNIILSPSSMWSVTFFMVLIYNLLTFTACLYLISNLKDFTKFNARSNNPTFTYVTGLDLLLVLGTPLLITIIVLISWSGAVVTSWFGHLIFTSLQLKVAYLIVGVFGLVCLSYATSFYFASQEVYDYTIVIYSFFLWTLLLFHANNTFTVIFFIEILSALISLLLTTSTFSSTYFYNNMSLTSHSYFSQSTPFAFLQTLMYFFWISLVSSLNLFVFLTLMYLKFVTFDWFTLDSIFFYIVSIADLKTLFFSSLVWFSFLFCIFLKCGLVPFYFWKPIFFKGTPMHALFFYTVFFYFFISYFFTYFLLIYLNELFYYNIFINFTMLLAGLLVLIFVICESYYLKAFIAISSILNTLFIFLAMSSYVIIDYTFLI